MKTQIIKTFATIMFIVILNFSKQGMCDGMMFNIPTATGTTEPADIDSQMAAIIISNDGSWDLYLRTHYSGEPSDFAWVVPFETRPEVDTNPVDEKFFKDLDELTATIFFSGDCYESCDNQGIGCGSTKAGENGNEIVNKNKVTVWESGQIGILDFVVISATDGGDILEWLHTSGFSVPDEAKTILDDMASKGNYFFAAKIQAGETTVKNITPIHFKFPAGTSPVYPMRLTSISKNEKVKFYIWVIDKGGNSWVPLNYPVMYIQGHGEIKDEITREEYNSTYESIISTGTGNTFIITYSTNSDQNKSNFGHYHGHIICDTSHSNQEYCSFEVVSNEMMKLLGKSSITLQEMNKPGNLGITRFEAQIPPPALTEDLRFRKAQEMEFGLVVNWFWEPCEVVVKDECSCSISKSKNSVYFPVSLVIFIITASVLIILKRKK